MKLAKSKKKIIGAAAAVILCAIVLVLIFGHMTGDDLLFKNKKNLVVQSYVTMDESNINALTGGQIKDVLVEEGDLIEIDIPRRVLRIAGIKGEAKSEEEILEVLEQRRKTWQPKPARYQSGVLKIYSEHAVGPMKGGYMK